MSTIFDLIEVTSIAANTTYSTAAGNLIGLVNSISGASLSDGEFDIGDMVTIGGQSWRIDAVRKPSSAGSFQLGDGTTVPFLTQSESNLDVVFLSVSSGPSVRHFIIPNDRFGALNIASIRTGGIANASGSDAAIISTTDHATAIVCFCRGTPIDVGGPRPVPVEALRPGDAVMTADGGLRPVAWVTARRVPAATLAAQPALGPIRVEAGSLAPAVPTRPVELSPQHRVLIRSAIAGRMFGATEVLVAVKHLVGWPGVRPTEGRADVDYVHLLFDRHEIVFAAGMACESLYPGPQARHAVDDATLVRLGARGLWPEGDAPPPPARPFVGGREARRLVQRHMQNRKPLVQTAPRTAEAVARKALPPPFADARPLHETSAGASRAASRP